MATLFPSIRRGSKPAAAQAPGRTLRQQLGQLLVRALSLGIPVLVFLLIFEARFVRSNPSHYTAKKKLLEQRASQVEILVMGPSHSLVGVSPARLERPAFNLAGNSQSLYYDLALLRKYRRALPNLRLVVQPISFLSLESELDEGPERWRCYYYKYFHGLPHRDWHMSYSARNYSAWFLCGSEISRMGVLFGTCPDPLKEYDAWGGWIHQLGGESAEHSNPAALGRSAETALKRHLQGMRPSNLSANLARLEAMVREMRAEGVDVLLVTLPVSRFYSGRIPGDRYARMGESLTNFCARHNVVWNNYLRDPRFEDSDFQDGDHLNGRGAAKFSELLAKNVAALLRP